MTTHGPAVRAQQRHENLRAAQPNDPWSGWSSSVTVGETAWLIPRNLRRHVAGPAALRDRHCRTFRIRKRVADIVLACILLAGFSVLLVTAAIAIKITSRGPVLFRQERYGSHNQRFEVLKFRSMVLGAQEQIDDVVEFAQVKGIRPIDAPAFKSPEDPRVTRIGRLLRRTGIDELPQLINVIAGDMSLVGPRPLVPAEAETLTEATLSHRHSVPPGLTGLWQVLRTESMSFEERMLLDLLYANRPSLRLDLALLLATPASMLRGEGAY